MLQKYWFYLVTLFSIIALGSAFIAEFYFNLAPCEMCLKQREPYYIIILGFIFFGKDWHKIAEAPKEIALSIYL